MIAASRQLRESNPFAARRVRPGAIPFFFPPGQNAGQLIDRLRKNGWWGQIVGPHGSGKSTLVESLLPKLCRIGMSPRVFRLCDSQSQLARGWRSGPLDRSGILVIDGFEQISRVKQIWIRCFCRVRKIGLLITAHESVGLPDLFHTEVTLAVGRRVVQHLLEGRPRRLRPGELDQRLAARGGNLREALFDLYDLYIRMPISTSSSPATRRRL